MLLRRKNPKRYRTEKVFSTNLLYVIWLLFGMIFITFVCLFILKRYSNRETCRHQYIENGKDSNRTEKHMVFISYKSEEYEIALRTKQILDDNGFFCWMAPHSIPAGSDYGVEIPKAISNSKVFLLVLSEASQRSEWVPKELGTAISLKKYIIPFHIDQSALIEPFNFSLINNQRIEAYKRMSDAYEELIKMLKTVLNSKKD